MNEDIIHYLENKSKELSDEKTNLDNGYDTYPQWVRERQSAITQEQVSIGRFIKFLKGE